MSEHTYPSYAAQIAGLDERMRAQALLGDLQRLLAKDCPEHLKPPIKALILLFQNFLRDENTTDKKVSPQSFLWMGKLWLSSAQDHLEQKRRRKEARQRLEEAAKIRLELLSAAPPAVRKDARPFCSAYRKFLNGKRPMQYPKTAHDIVLDHGEFLRETERFAAVAQPKGGRVTVLSPQTGVAA